MFSKLLFLVYLLINTKIVGLKDHAAESPHVVIKEENRAEKGADIFDLWHFLQAEGTYETGTMGIGRGKPSIRKESKPEEEESEIDDEEDRQPQSGHLNSFAACFHGKCADTRQRPRAKGAEKEKI